MRRVFTKTHTVWQHYPKLPRLGAVRLFQGSREECEQFIRDSVLDDEQPDTWISGDDNPLVDEYGVRVRYR